MKVLRPYQSECVDAVEVAINNGQSRTVVAMATGLGKSLTAAHIIKRRIHLGRALFLAPIDEVVFQNAKAVQGEIEDIPIGIVKAEFNQAHARIIIASLHTLRRKNRLNALPAESFETIIVDECHLNLDAYKTVIEHVASPHAAVIGLSASPYRHDGRGLDEVFDSVAYEMDIVRGIQEGYLVEPDALQFRLKGANFSKVKTQGGDLQVSGLEKVMKSASFTEQITTHWLKHAADKRTVIFLPKVEMAYELAEFMRAGGIRAEALDGGTGKGDRREIFARYESGETQVLCNVLVLSTGWDSPITECLVMARPTKSKALYIQAMGRGLRTLSGVIDGLETAEERLAAIAASAKPSCLVMDMIGVTGKHKLMTLVDLMGVAKPKARRKLTELVKDAEAEKAEREERERIEAELEAKRVKLIEDHQFDTRKNNWPQFAWTADFFSNRESLHVRDVTITVRQMADGQSWIAADNKQQFRFVNGSAETCKKEAEDYARKVLFSNPNSLWRKKPASEKQIARLRQWRIPFADGISAGEASDLIGKYLEARKREKANV